jgi:tRNA U38,U39,U40 pseudouridine synthase TruA
MISGRQKCFSRLALTGRIILLSGMTIVQGRICIMVNIKMIIRYDGSRYRGWQRLGDSDKTIQGKIESVLSAMTGENIEVIGSGRTDAGAHAINQTCNFHTRCNMSIDEMLDYCSSYLHRIFRL